MTYADKNAQSYNKGAEEWAARVPSNAGHLYLEKPAMENELPKSLSGMSVLCVGVGSGYEIDEIIRRNPKTILGIDTSEKLLEIARLAYPDIRFINMDMMNMDFSDELFDVVYSSLAFHYANDWDVLLAGVHRILRSGGMLLFSTHHPVYWSKNPKTGTTHTNSRGIILTEHTATLPAGNIDITYYNHDSEHSIKDSLVYAGFVIKSFFAPQVTGMPPEQYLQLSEYEKAGYDKIREKNSASPLFLVVRAIRV